MSNGDRVAQLVRCSACMKLKPANQQRREPSSGGVRFICWDCVQRRSVQQDQAKEAAMHTQQKIDRVREICDRMVADGIVLSASEVSRQATDGISNWIHTNATAKGIYEQAIKKLRAAGKVDEKEEDEQPAVKSQEEEPAPVQLAPVVQLEEELHQLRQQLERRERELEMLQQVKADIERKDQRLSELESKLAESDRELEKAAAYANALEDELNSMKQQPATHASNPYEWIVSQRQIWQGKVEQLTSELVTAQKNLSAFKLLAELYETSEVELPLLLNLQESDGPKRTNNQIPGGNGNHRGADADQPAAADAELHRSL